MHLFDLTPDHKMFNLNVFRSVASLVVFREVQLGMGSELESMTFSLEIKFCLITIYKLCLRREGSRSGLFDTFQ